MVNQRYKGMVLDHCVFMKRYSDGDFIILLLYVDNMLIVRYDRSKIDKLKKS